MSVRRVSPEALWLHDEARREDAPAPIPENAIGGSVVEMGDLIEVSYGPILLLRIVDLVETGPHS